MMGLAAEHYRLEEQAAPDSIDRMLEICDAMNDWTASLRGTPLSLEQYHLVQTAEQILSTRPKLRAARSRAVRERV
jgi:hypothetical protein